MKTIAYVTYTLILGASLLALALDALNLPKRPKLPRDWPIYLAIALSLLALLGLGLVLGAGNP